MDEQDEQDEQDERATAGEGGPAGGGGSTRVWAVLVRAGLDAGLRAVPVVGELVPADADLRLEALSAVALSKAPVPDEVRRLNVGLAQVAGGDLLLREDLKSSLAVGVTASFAGKREDIWAMQGASAKSGTVTGGRFPDDKGAGTTGVIGWVPVGRGLGPVRLERLGVQYKAPPATVSVLADASVELAGLTFAADGMGLGIDVKDPSKVTAHLAGLGLAWDRPPVKVSGAFLLRDDSGYSVLIEGAAAVETPALALVAVGGYAQKSGHGPSVFVFGRLALKDGEGVGPPPFRITGAAAGFGFNSTARIPEVEELGDFPLMPQGAGDLLTSPLVYLDKLTGGTAPWISPAPGRAWLAAGLDFDSFKFLKGSAMALVDFGTGADQDFTLALLGHLAAEFPDSANPFAKVGLDLSASYSSRTDTLGAYARISPGSYVVHPSCQLSGGAALCLWFGASAHPGDFVATVGGYHPRFAGTKPAHYPDVERLQLSWSVSDNVSMRGDCYAALTPSAFMVGADVSVSFHAGPVKAGCDVGMDALVQWDPFHFEVTAHADIWVELDVLIPLRGTFGVGVEFWGPPTGGTATVHALGRSFDIRFGEDRPTGPRLIGWPEFRDSRLHRPVVELHPAEGLLPVTGSDKDAVWQMSRNAFTLTTCSAVPITRVRLRTDPKNTDPAKDRTPTGWKDRDDVPVRPVGLGKLTSTHTVQVTHDGNGFDTEGHKWTVEPVTGKVPLGLWGAPLGSEDAPALPSGDATTDAVTGLRLVVPPAGKDDPGLATTERILDFEEIEGPAEPLPVQPSPLPAARAASDVRVTIAETVTGSGADGRDALADQLAGWNLAPAGRGACCTPDDLRHYRDHLWRYLRSEPLLCKDTEGTA
ncbi:DUF6603 domain-containing protein [Kitasatospora sp. NPDC097605]|uniref:DUF6603 domain-containing protein n=1 Tax=Kitasatospora sp. NPDC097605 TaxID=3157226 RepID=UPI00332759AA